MTLKYHTTAGWLFAVVREERLSDNSLAYNVTFEAGDSRVTIGATNKNGAEAIAAAINEHAAWIE